MRVLAIGLFGALVAPLAVSAQANGCSHDVLRIDRAEVSVTLCAGAKHRGADANTATIPLTETFSSGDQTFSRTASLEFMQRKEASRSLEDVSLEPLGISKTLHLTVTYEAGAVRLDHALLVPGAVILK